MAFTSINRFRILVIADILVILCCNAPSSAQASGCCNVKVNVQCGNAPSPAQGNEQCNAKDKPKPQSHLSPQFQSKRPLQSSTATSDTTPRSPTTDAAANFGYYWRDFFGELPVDALEGGIAADGNPIYIGQILYENKLLTAKIYKDDKNAYYPLAYKELNGTENVKVLCTLTPEDFVWIPTETNKIDLLTDVQLIIGGYEPTYIMYIGRAFYKSELCVGKISTRSGGDNLGLYLGLDGEEINFKDPFEILSYQPKT